MMLDTLKLASWQRRESESETQTFKFWLVSPRQPYSVFEKIVVVVCFLKPSRIIIATCVLNIEYEA
jgi:hypothetical protein